MRSYRFLAAAAVLLTALLHVPAHSASGGALWVSPLEGDLTPESALEAGAVVRDRFPEALVLADAGSADALTAARHRVDGPFRVREGAGVFLLRPRGSSPAGEGTAAAVAAIPGSRILWSDGTCFLLEVIGELPPVLPAGLSRKVLSDVPLRVREPEELPGTERLGATVFDPLVDQVVAQVDSAAYFPWISRLAGAEPVTVGGASTTISSRYSKARGCEDAEQYVFEQFRAMGFATAAYDSFQFVPGGAYSRNVIATLPGTETPDQVYILCGHLDSTSPTPYGNAPGANDNASGTAAVLAGAEILKDFSFRSTIRFVAFTGEEQGLVGSTHYAQAMSSAGENILGVVNCDMIAWWGSNYEIIIEGRQIADPIMQVMNDACGRYTGLTTQLDYSAWGSDHVPFLNSGFPAFLAIERDYGSYPCYHQACDTAGLQDAAFGVEVTRACLATVAHLAGIVDPSTTAPIPGAGAPGLALRPNPFRADVMVSFALDRPGRARLAVYDVAGRLVRTLLDGALSADAHERRWDGRSDGAGRTPAGIYFVRLQTGTRDETVRIVRVE